MKTSFVLDADGPWIEKAPGAVLDYGFDWSAWLAADTISSSAWSVTAGIVANTNTHDETTTTVWLSGGELDDEYIVTNTIVTTGGRTESRSFRMVVRER